MNKMYGLFRASLSALGRAVSKLRKLLPHRAVRPQPVGKVMEIFPYNFIPRSYVNHAAGSHRGRVDGHQIGEASIAAFDNGETVIEVPGGCLVVIDNKGRLVAARIPCDESKSASSSSTSSRASCLMDVGGFVASTVEDGKVVHKLPGGVTITDRGEAVSVRMGNGIVVDKIYGSGTACGA